MEFKNNDEYRVFSYLLAGDVREDIEKRIAHDGQKSWYNLVHNAAEFFVVRVAHQLGVKLCDIRRKYIAHTIYMALFQEERPWW